MRKLEPLEELLLFGPAHLGVLSFGTNLVQMPLGRCDGDVELKELKVF